MFGPEQAYLNSVRHAVLTPSARELAAYRSLEDAELNLAPVRLPSAAAVRTPSRTSGAAVRRPWAVRVAELLRLSRDAPASDPNGPGHVARGRGSGNDGHRGAVPPAHPMDLGAGPHPPSTSKY